MYGVSVAEKKIVWLKVRAEGVAGHGSQPHDQNPNDRLVRALNRLLTTPAGAVPAPIAASAQGDAASPLDVMLFDVPAADPITFTSVSGVLIGAALAASYLPARRAARVDPMQALRTD